MTAVQAYSKTKTDQLLAENIVDAALVGDNLILTKRSGAHLPAMNVRGASGAAASTGAINAAVAAAMADAPQGIMKHDTVGTAQAISANGATWYTVATLSITDTIVDGRVYEISGGAILTSATSLIGIDVEIRAGATFSTGEPVARETNFVYDSGRGIGFNLSRKIKGVTGTFVGSKTFQIGFRCSGDSDISITSDYCDSHITLVDLGVL
jgi:hypothetical protein